MKLIDVAITTLTVSALSACAGPHASGTYETSASFGKLYSAALHAVPSVGYSVVSSNRADGLIVAQQNVVMGSGSAVRLNSSITDQSGHRLLHVDFNAPPGTMALGNFDQNLAEYIGSVRASVPDLAPRP